MTHLPEPFPVVPLDMAWADADEAMGTKRKGWFRRPETGRLWLFKHSRLSDGKVMGEHWSEKLGAECAEILGVPHARVELAQVQGHYGSISERFPLLDAPNAELRHGNEVLGLVHQGYQQEQRWDQRQHTFARISDAICRSIVFPPLPEVSSSVPALEQEFFRSPEMQDLHRQRRERSLVDAEQAVRHMAGIIVLDALILNTDRHHENWGIIRYADDEGQMRHALTPSFDHASSLARNESEEKCRQWLEDQRQDHVQRYVRKGSGAIWWDPEDRKAPSPLDLALRLAQQHPDLFAPWLERLRAVPPGVWGSLVQRVPVDMLGPWQRQLVTRLLTSTHHTLASCS